MPVIRILLPHLLFAENLFFLMFTFYNPSFQLLVVQRVCFTSPSLQKSAEDSVKQIFCSHCPGRLEGALECLSPSHPSKENSRCPNQNRKRKKPLPVA